ncbi:hypothetical protein AB1K54_05830 [Microbacterium sp. BWT-B31]|uniref:DUF7657 domain-containing protein n=1 Tax=Microbacterium sp. BWT-B31 TaxID=3232072 RepID=UPI003528EE1E
MVSLPLGLLAMVFVVLVGLGLTGSSSGAVHSLISTSADADLVSGHPQAIRSDEWFVQTPWTISQVEQGLPIRNETFPGGMDATVQHDLPALDWSTALRPHLLGFLVLPLDQAMAFKWWLPGFAMIAAVYLFVVALLPRRPVAASMIAVGFFFAPFFQWWYLSITFFAAAWAFLVMATVVWSLKSRGRWGPWVLAALCSYVTVTMGTTIYVPFIVPAVLVTLAFSVGAVLTRDAKGESIGRRVRRMIPLLVAGAVAIAVLALWLLTRWQTIVGFTSTVYPGERLQNVGGAGLREFDALFSGPLSGSLESTSGHPFAANSSEASTFLLPGIFLAVVLVWLVVDRFRSTRRIDWLTVAVLAMGALLLAFLFIPGWDPVAHVLLLDRTTYGRVRMGFGILSIVMIVLVAVRISEHREAGLRPVPHWVAAVCTLLAAVVVARVAWVLVREFGLSALREQVHLTGMVAAAVVLLLFVGSVWLFARGHLAGGAAVVLVVSIAAASGVNPLYRGVVDLRETDIAAEIERLNANSPGNWVGISTTTLPTMLLIETAVPSFNGFQSAPSEDMWSEIDPGGREEAIWNRLANVSWVVGEGEPDPRNPAQDQIQMTFDSCSVFAQENVRWVISEVPVQQSCLSLISTVTEGPTVMRFYEVVAD